MFSIWEKVSGAIMVKGLLGSGLGLGANQNRKKGWKASLAGTCRQALLRESRLEGELGINSC